MNEDPFEELMARDLLHEAMDIVRLKLFPMALKQRQEKKLQFKMRQPLQEATVYLPSSYDWQLVKQLWKLSYLLIEGVNVVDVAWWWHDSAAVYRRKTLNGGQEFYEMRVYYKDPEEYDDKYPEVYV